ncbi:DUF1045 domain-containing protein [Telmatospirillum sp. J64-1]|uniref:DUF1045 domain-containing protein n=1 Tax=Telmatospirillum sp. J64-1 TaxID=2502183 RepID=UPI00115F409F|nr:DUF1045 domain-containing protein [Telmatospirillum sp. J64-1]
MERWAIYYAPAADTSLDVLGRRWLGRSAHDGRSQERPSVPGLTADKIAAVTAEPARYGFHATLKPPFALVPSRRPEELRQALADFAAKRSAFEAPPLRLAELGRFLALIPSAPCPALEELAAESVRHFDGFRAPPSAAELQRRRSRPLTPRQEALLEAWGYPYIMEEFRFHMTLTGPLQEEDRAALRESLDVLCAEATRQPLLIDGLTLFRQPAADAPFVIETRFPFRPRD